MMMGVFLRGVFRDVNGGEQLHAVTDGNSVVEPGVVGARVFQLFARGFFGAGRGCRLCGQQSGDGEGEKDGGPGSREMVAKFRRQFSLLSRALAC
jgi:hypothetical protein